MLSETMGSWPCYEDDEMAAVHDVLQSGRVNYWTGDQGRSFEKEFAEYCQTKHAIAVANGTVALELALHALGVGSGDDVVVTPRTFLASASCAVMRDARPVFADIDPDSENISAATVAAALTPNTKAVIAVHHAGWPCDMDAIMTLANQHGFYVIEDCAQAHGAQYKNRPVGSFGHMAAFSFCQDKIMTTGGEGGMLVTNDEKLWKNAWAYKDHGKSYDAVYNKKHPEGYRWLHESFGTNWRLTEMQSAIGRLQLRKLDNWNKKRSANADRFKRVLSEFAAIRVPHVPTHIVHAYYRFYFHVQTDQLQADWSRDRIMQEITALGTPIFSGSCPEIYREKAFANRYDEAIKPMPNAETLGNSSLALPVHPTLSDADLDLYCANIRTVLNKACRA